MNHTRRKRGTAWLGVSVALVLAIGAHAALFAVLNSMGYLGSFRAAQPELRSPRPVAEIAPPAAPVPPAPQLVPVQPPPPQTAHIAPNKSRVVSTSSGSSSKKDLLLPGRLLRYEEDPVEAPREERVAAPAPSGAAKLHPSSELLQRALGPKPMQDVAGRPASPVSTQPAPADQRSR